jgi:hypothetical protein
VAVRAHSVLLIGGDRQLCEKVFTYISFEI